MDGWMGVGGCEFNQHHFWGAASAAHNDIRKLRCNNDGKQDGLICTNKIWMKCVLDIMNIKSCVAMRQIYNRESRHRKGHSCWKTSVKTLRGGMWGAGEGQEVPLEGLI
jgi:hypothetical protein